MAGKPYYQAPEYQSSLNGPIPEGNWYMRQNQFQNFDDLSTKEKAISYVGGMTNVALENSADRVIFEEPERSVH